MGFMTNRKKITMPFKWLSMLLIVCLLLSYGAIGVSAADTAGDGHTYDTGGDDYEISLYSQSVDTEYEDVLATYKSVDSYGLTERERRDAGCVFGCPGGQRSAQTAANYEGYAATPFTRIKRLAILPGLLRSAKRGCISSI